MGPGLSTGRDACSSLRQEDGERGVAVLGSGPSSGRAGTSAGRWVDGRGWSRGRGSRRVAVWEAGTLVKAAGSHRHRYRTCRTDGKQVLGEGVPWLASGVAPRAVPRPGLWLVRRGGGPPGAGLVGGPRSRGCSPRGRGASFLLFHPWPRGDWVFGQLPPGRAALAWPDSSTAGHAPACEHSPGHATSKAPSAAEPACGCSRPCASPPLDARWQLRDL